MLSAVQWRRARGAPLAVQQCRASGLFGCAGHNALRAGRIGAVSGSEQVRHQPEAAGEIGEPAVAEPAHGFGHWQVHAAAATGAHILLHLACASS